MDARIELSAGMGHAAPRLTPPSMKSREDPQPSVRVSMPPYPRSSGWAPLVALAAGSPRVRIAIVASVS